MYILVLHQHNSDLNRQYRPFLQARLIEDINEKTIITELTDMLPPGESFVPTNLAYHTVNDDIKSGFFGFITTTNNDQQTSWKYTVFPA